MRRMAEDRKYLEEIGLIGKRTTPKSDAVTSIRTEKKERKNEGKKEVSLVENLPLKLFQV